MSIPFNNDTEQPRVISTINSDGEREVVDKKDASIGKDTMWLRLMCKN